MRVRGLGSLTAIVRLCYGCMNSLNCLAGPPDLRPLQAGYHVSYKYPPDNREAGNPGHLADHADIADMLRAIGGINVLDHGADPTGSSECSGAFNAALLQASDRAGSVSVTTVYAPPGRYSIGRPIVIPPYTSLVGTIGSNQISHSVSGPVAGTVLQISPGFTKDVLPVSACILAVDQETGNWDTETRETGVFNLMVDGTNAAPASDCAGIATYGAVNQMKAQNVHTYNVPSWGYVSVEGGGRWGGHRRFINVTHKYPGRVSANNAGGFYIRNIDSNFIHCYVGNPQRGGGGTPGSGSAFVIYDSYDSKFVNCHAEHMGNGHGFHVVSGYNNGQVFGGGISFLGCVIDSGTMNGFHVSDGNAFGDRGCDYAPPIVIVGGFSKRTGTDGNNRGAFTVDGYRGPVSLCGVTSYNGQPDGGGAISPEYGLNVINGNPRTSVTVGGGSVLNGMLAPYRSDGSALVTIGPDTVLQSGNGNSTETRIPGVALLDSRTGVLQPTDIPCQVAPAAAVAASHPIDQIHTDTLTLTSGRPVFAAVRLVAGTHVGKIHCWTRGAGTPRYSHQWGAVLDSAGTVMAVSADTTSQFRADAAVTFAVDYWPAETGLYYIAINATFTGAGPSVSAAPSLPYRMAGFSTDICGTAGSGFTAPPSPNARLTLKPDNSQNLFVWATAS